MAAIVALGFIIKLKLKIDRNTIAYILFYLLVPIIFFTTVSKMDLTIKTFSIPLIIVFISGIICIIMSKLSIVSKQDTIRNFLAFSAPNGNVGYFLLPVTWVLFSNEAVALYILIIIGNIVYENTIGFYIAARGKFSIEESFSKLLRLPAIYSFIAGIIFSFFSIKIPFMFDDLIYQTKGAYSLFGMLIIGVALAEIKWDKLDYNFIGWSFFGKYIATAIVTFLLIFIDKNIFHIYNNEVYQLFILASAAPLAANNIVIGSVVGACPNRAASAVLFTTIFSVFYVPFVISYF